MQTDSLFTDASKPEREPHQVGLRPAVVVSLALHLGLALAVSRVALVPGERTDSEIATNTVSVSLAPRSPQQSTSPPPVEVAVSEPLPDTAADAREAAPVPPPLTEAPPVETEAVALADTAPVPSSAGPADEALTDDSASSVSLNMQALRSTIDTQIAAYRRDLLDQRMQECQQYRERYQRWNCPQGEEVKSATQALIDEQVGASFRAWVSGHDRNARISQELLDDMDALRPLMNDNGVLGVLARERYSIKADQYIYLNPGARKPGEVMPAPSPAGDVATLITLSPTQIVVLNGLLTISLRGIRVRDEHYKGPARPFDEDDE